MGKLIFFCAKGLLVYLGFSLLVALAARFGVHYIDSSLAHFASGCYLGWAARKDFQANASHMKP